MPTAVVAVKHVPVGGASLRVMAGEISREGVSHGIDPLNEVSLEWALRQRDAGALDRVVAVAVGPEGAVDTLRQALALGADDAVLVTAAGESDVRLTARLLAAAASSYAADLVVLGYESPDGSSGAVPAAVAATLRRPLVSRMRDGALDGGRVTGSRDLGAGPEEVTTSLPAVLSIVDGTVTPRFPKLKQLMAARSAPITRLTQAELGVDAPKGAVSNVTIEAVEQPETNARVVDLHTGVEELFTVLAGGAA